MHGLCVCVRGCAYVCVGLVLAAQKGGDSPRLHLFNSCLNVAGRFGEL